MTYVVKLDYLTLNFEPGKIDLNEIGNSLAARTDLHWLQFRSDRENAPYQSPLGLFYRPDCGSVETPHVLQIHGSGCENFRSSLPVLFSKAHHVRRADFCFDVIMKKDEWRQWLGQVFGMQWEKRRKKIVLVSDGDASTVYVGTRSSETYFRVYNKSLQNPDYQLIDPLGCPLPVPDDSFIIRYEVETTWKKRQRAGSDASFDPGPLVDQYYSDPERLSDWLRSIWLKHGNDVLLPDGFEDSFFVTDVQALGLEVADGAIVPPSAIENVDTALHDFDSKLDYAARFAKYVPYLLMRPGFIEDAIIQARCAFGFAGDIFVVYDAPEFLDDDVMSYDVDFEFSDPEFEQAEIPIV